MIDIKTNIFKLEPNDYYKIVATNRIKRYWWVYLLSFIMGTIHLSRFGTSEFSTFIVILGFLYPFFVFAYLYFWTTSKKNENLFLERQFHFGQDKISSTLDDGLINEMNWSHILKVIERKDYWLLYISKAQFIYIPRSAFNSKNDITELEAKLKALPNMG